MFWLSFSPIEQEKRGTYFFQFLLWILPASVTASVGRRLRLYVYLMLFLARTKSNTVGTAVHKNYWLYPLINRQLHWIQLPGKRNIIHFTNVRLCWKCTKVGYWTDWVDWHIPWKICEISMARISFQHPSERDADYLRRAILQRNTTRYDLVSANTRQNTEENVKLRPNSWTKSRQKS